MLPFASLFIGPGYSKNGSMLLIKSSSTSLQKRWTSSNNGLSNKQTDHCLLQVSWSDTIAIIGPKLNHLVQLPNQSWNGINQVSSSNNNNNNKQHQQQKKNKRKTAVAGSTAAKIASTVCFCLALGSSYWKAGYPPLGQPCQRILHLWNALL